jgi:hypothetical protein
MGKHRLLCSVFKCLIYFLILRTLYSSFWMVAESDYLSFLSVRSCLKWHIYQFRQVKHAILGNSMNHFWCLQFLSLTLLSYHTQRAYDARTPSFLWGTVYRLCCWLCVLRSNLDIVCGLSNGSSFLNLSEAFANHTLVLASRNRW